MQGLSNILVSIINAFTNYLVNFGVPSDIASELGGFVLALLISTILILIAAGAPIARRVAVFAIAIIWILVVLSL